MTLGCIRAMTDRRKKQPMQAPGRLLSNAKIDSPSTCDGIRTHITTILTLIWKACPLPDTSFSSSVGNQTLNGILEIPSAGSLHLYLDRSIKQIPAPEAAPTVLPTEDLATVLDVSKVLLGFMQSV